MRFHSLNAQHSILDSNEHTLNAPGYVLYEDFKVLLQEAPEAYKDIDAVVNDLKHHGLVEVVAVMRPHVTCKF